MAVVFRERTAVARASIETYIVVDNDVSGVLFPIVDSFTAHGFSAELSYYQFTTSKKNTLCKGNTVIMLAAGLHHGQQAIEQAIGLRAVFLDKELMNWDPRWKAQLDAGERINATTRDEGIALAERAIRHADRPYIACINDTPDDMRARLLELHGDDHADRLLPLGKDLDLIVRTMSHIMEGRKVVPRPVIVARPVRRSALGLFRQEFYEPALGSG